MGVFRDNPDHLIRSPARPNSTNTPPEKNRFDFQGPMVRTRLKKCLSPSLAGSS